MKLRKFGLYNALFLLCKVFEMFMGHKGELRPWEATYREISNEILWFLQKKLPTLYSIEV